MQYRLLFQVVAARYEFRSIVLFTNRPVREWCNLFEMDNIMPTALIDRLIQYEEAIVFQGASYGMRDNATDSPPARDAVRYVHVRRGVLCEVN